MSQQKHASRRDFLKGTTAAAAGAALTAAWNPSRMAHAAAGGPRKVALIGCGGRGTGAAGDHLRAAEELGDDVKLIAVADAFADKVEGTVSRLSKEFPKAVDVPKERMFSGLDAFQKAIAAGVDTVIMATPPGFRPYHYKAAIEAGKHVFMEKPCCVDAVGYNILLAANKLADEKNLKVGVGFQRRHTPTYVETMKRIHDGAIGDLPVVRGYWNGGGIWFRDRKPGMSEMEYQVLNWYHFVWLSGDNICEQHIHNIDVCNWAKNDHPVEANGMGSCVQRYNGRDPQKGMGQIFDNHFVEFTYKDGSKFYSQCRHIPKTWGIVDEFIQGVKGEAHPSAGYIKFKSGEEWKYEGPGLTKGKAKAKRSGFNSMTQEHKDLITAIRQDQKYNEGHYGATSSFTAVLGRMATYSGQIVKWDDAAAKGTSEFPDKLAWDAAPKVLPDKDGKYPIAIPGQYKPY